MEDNVRTHLIDARSLVRSALALAALLAAAAVAAAADWYAAPDAKPGAAGTRDSPLNIETALASPKVQPGDTEIYGCIIYDNGWPATDRGHGHAIYTQNKDGITTISDCIMTGGHGYTMHAYGSSRAYVDNFRLLQNIAYKGGSFLIGGGRP